MTSKEALRNMCENCEKEKGARKQRCPFRSISNDYCDEYETIEKDLKYKDLLFEFIDLLEKEPIHSSYMIKDLKTIKKKIKELENDKEN